MSVALGYSKVLESTAAPRDAEASPAVELRAVSVERMSRLILKNVDLCISPGETATVLGSNGAGKTTLLRCLAGLTKPTSGKLLWHGKPSNRETKLRRSIGMVAHQHWTYAELTVRENLLFAASMYGLVDAVTRVEQLLTEADLQRHRDDPAGKLSHGWRQRLSICRALVHDPTIVLLDEPFSGLDNDGRQWLEQLLVQLRSRSRAICLTTHDRAVARRLANSVLRLEGGRLHRGPEIIAEADLRRYCEEDAA